MKTYICKVEGLLMVSPAVILHEGQKLQVSEDTIEIFAALKAGQLEPADNSKEAAAELQVEAQAPATAAGKPLAESQEKATAAEKPLVESQAKATAAEETPAQKPKSKGGRK